ncbi:MAG: galactokinase [Desulfobacterales bacterium]|jgi:D-glycero-alpha-D-manno-heptose-7-phosphate kinase|nr:galactokinase [Desulfobacterales bacterium]
MTVLKRNRFTGTSEADFSGSSFDWQKALEEGPVAVSAPCRVDMGGTLDIRTFSYPLRHLGPCTVNIALDLRTTVRLAPHARGRVKVSSRGFKSADFPADQSPFRHPLGLMFATAAFFNAQGVHIRVESGSPPRSALGGSSTAAVALVRAFMEVLRRGRRSAALDGRSVALLAHAVEESVAGVPCGCQDQLAAAFGGVNAWHWLALPRAQVFRRERLIPRPGLRGLEPHLLAAYAGVPHESSDINSRWVRQFVAGRFRGEWADILACTQRFADALRRRDFDGAAAAMNRETDIRRRMTPGVLDRLGRRLTAAARRNGCGARFTGAGGGGCLWAVGAADAVARLKPVWQEILSERRPARLLEVKVAGEGLKICS